MPVIPHPYPPAPDGAVALIRRDDQRVLLIRRAQGVDAPGCFCFPGGRVRSGERAADAACREAYEETGLRIRVIRHIWTCRLSQGTRLDWFLCRLSDPGQTVALDPNEADDAQWLLLEDIAELDRLLPSVPAFIAAVTAGDISLTTEGERL